MGKKTLYHPVSLHVIRGAAEYCGFRFGAIKQKWNSLQNQEAEYTAEIVKMPDDMAKTGTLLGIHHALQSCFMDDIRVLWVHMTRSEKWSCQLIVSLIKEESPVLPNPEPGIEPLYSQPGGGGGGEVDLSWLMPDDFDNLRLCSVCGDRETQEDVCWVCRQQAMIDESVPSGINYDACYSCGLSLDQSPEYYTAKNGMNYCHECFWQLEEAGGGGGGGGEQDAPIKAYMNSDAVLSCHFCHNEVFQTSIFKADPALGLQILSGYECRKCWALYNDRLDLIQPPPGPDNDPWSWA